MSGWYRMLDAPETSKAAIPVDRADAARWNTVKLGFGIFATVNAFDGPRRKEHLRKIRAWAVDMDEGTKAEQRARILRSPLVPSLVVETKRGYQAYWRAKDGQPTHWNAIVLERLVPFFGADKNARDLCRILRVPGFFHLKDPSTPFLVKLVHELDVTYSERQIGEAFTWVPDRAAHDAALAEMKRADTAAAREAAKVHALATGTAPTETFWEAVYALDARETLARLSGSSWVSGEVYSFRLTGRGRWNIFVDGKSSSCFVDERGHIGSLSGGGPTPAQWLKWLGRSWKEVVEALKHVHPHLADIDEASRKAARAA